MVYFMISLNHKDSVTRVNGAESVNITGYYILGWKKGDSYIYLSFAKHD